MDTAQKISALLDDDGQIWETADGQTIEDLCLEHGGDLAERSPGVDDINRYAFADGSAITIQGRCGWDLGYADCYCWQGVGHTEECLEDLEDLS